MNAQDDALRTVLIVDDDETLRQVAEVALGEVGGLEVRTAGTGAEAQALCDNAWPDLVLMDLRLDPEDGRTVWRNLLARVPVGREGYVVFLTASSEEETRGLEGETGALKVLAKPVSIMTLAQDLRGLWEARSQ